MGIKDMFKKKDGQEPAEKKKKEKNESYDASPDADVLYHQLLEDYPEEEAKLMLEKILSLNEDSQNDKQ